MAYENESGREGSNANVTARTDDADPWLWLIEQAHRDADALRKTRGLPPYQWPMVARPVGGYLSRVERRIQFQGEMAMQKNFKCKVCDHDGGSPLGMRDHYVGHPDHMPATARASKAARDAAKSGKVVKRGVGRSRLTPQIGALASRPNGRYADPVSSASRGHSQSSIFDDLGSLSVRFDAAINNETKAIAELQSQLSAHQAELKKVQRPAQLLVVLTREPEAVPGDTDVSGIYGQVGGQTQAAQQ